MSLDLAITGLGLVTPLGVGREAVFEGLREPDAATQEAFRGPSSVLEAYDRAHVAEVWGWDPREHLGARGHRSLDRMTQFMIAAARQTLGDAGLARDGALTVYDGDRVGLCTATAYGSLDAISELSRVAELEDPRYINPTRFPNTVANAAAGYVAIWEGLRGPNTTMIDGHCGALDCVLNAATHLRLGRADALLVGGAEVLSEPLYVALAKLGLLRDAHEPERGLCLGEGACYLAVERADAAAARGARVLGKLSGYGSAFEPPARESRLVEASPDAVSRAVRDALDEAGLAPRDVDAVASSHADLPALDDAELAGLRDVFGDDVRVAAPKQVFGETFGAAGALGLAAGLAWLAGCPVAPLVGGGRDVAGERPPRVVVATTVGFYGNASAVALTAA
ncbi:MAG: hypothetical protein KC543_00495 [Myxococcales bacterium]|nr:hypothetical protein [Myxococcales bacterium]